MLIWAQKIDKASAMMNVEEEKIFPQGGCGYADLCLAYKAGGAEGLGFIAKLLEFGQEERKLDDVALIFPPMLAEKREAVQSLPASYPEKAVPTPFLCLEKREFSEPLSLGDAPQLSDKEKGRDTRPDALPSGTRLNLWNALVPRVRSCFTQQGEGKALDVDGVVHRIVQGRTLDRLPRRSRRRWGSNIQIILDRSQRLISVQDDQDWVALRLASLFPHQMVEYVLCLEEMEKLIIADSHRPWRKYRIPDPGTLVVVLGDLGCLAANAHELVVRWEGLGKDLLHGGCRPMVLTSCPVSRWLPEQLPSWTMLPWVGGGEGVRPSAEELEARADRLLALLSPAIRIEPGLLREIRLLLGENADAGTEADVWMHPVMLGRSRVAGCLDPGELNRLREGFARESRDIQEKVVECLRRWRAGLDSKVWFEELLQMPEEQLPRSIRENDLLAARQHFKELPAQVAEAGERQEWYQRVHRRASVAYHCHGDRELKQAQDRMFAISFRDEKDSLFPQDFDLRLLPPLHDQPVPIAIYQKSDRIVAGSKAGVSLLAVIHSRQDRVQIVENGSSSFLAKSDETTQPKWADAMGRDVYGLWAEIAISGKNARPVTQRLRWIPPGRFMMGSPENEPERFPDEGPRHEVTFKDGYWLFDTACTQELWQAVMDDNPSRFKFSNHPVDQVYFEDVQKFLEKINKDNPGLELILPSEAQWEYACRAGTVTPFSFGENITPEQVNYDGNHPYRGGVKGEYRNKTVPVASLPANPWGLYEMHGNVWEWCADMWHDSYEGAPADGSVWDGPTGQRVLRGGSWYDHARVVRAACRDLGSRANRYDNLGFRCARVQSS
ncbi:MAG: Sulphatase-modifying factor protein [Magnetococcales bacterium]|nr:Sulphatase-modifying factor protein [Magnetococcales bacterium]